MALGRLLFIYTLHALYKSVHALFQLPPERAYLLFKFTVFTTGPLAVIVCWRLAHTLTRSREAATVAALFVATSPIFVLYGGQVMTDVPSVLLVALSLLVHLRGAREKNLWLILAGAGLLGAGVNMRETVMFYAPWLLLAPFACGWKIGKRELLWTALACLVFLICAFGPFITLFLSDAGYRDSWHIWRETMAAEAARHPVSIENLLPFAVFLFGAAPLVFIAFVPASIKEWREHKLSPLLALALVGLFADLLLIFNYSTAINWRYLLTGLPALAPLAANYFIRTQTKMLGTKLCAFLSTLAAIALISILCAIYLKPTSSEHMSVRALSKDYDARLKLVPQDAVMISGAQTVAVTYWRGIGLGRWDVIGTGSGWPAGQLTSVITDYLKQGRRVFLDADPRWWSPCGWQQEETRELVGQESLFHFRRVADNLYELRPSSDDTAHDAPNLQSLSPENRPDEVSSCKGLKRKKG